MSKQGLKIVHLYPEQMNIYGDTGNTLVLRRRLEWRKIEAEVIGVEVGEELPTDCDIIIAGGGQDKGQSIVESDLFGRRDELHALADDGVSMLVICGTYQLFGHRFVTGRDESIEGIGLLDIETFAGQERLIGNITIETDIGQLVGYENHSGLTYIGADAEPFGTVTAGVGNNTEDTTEGARYKNVVGTYLHGPILPKNPLLADRLIMQAMERKYGNSKLEPLDDAVEAAAYKTAVSRPR